MIRIAKTRRKPNLPLGLLSGLLMFASACGNGSTDSGLDLNTRARTHTGTFLEIQRWDPVAAVWTETSDKLPMAIEWRFVSATELAAGYSVSGSYTILYLNFGEDPVDVTVSGFNFLDDSRVVAADFRLDPEQTLNIDTDDQETRTGFFVLALNDLGIAAEISRMEVVGEAAFER